MKNKYIAPVAYTVEFESVDVVAMSIMDFLITWGKSVGSVDYSSENTSGTAFKNFYN